MRGNVFFPILRTPPIKHNTPYETIDTISDLTVNMRMIRTWITTYYIESELVESTEKNLCYSVTMDSIVVERIYITKTDINALERKIRMYLKVLLCIFTYALPLFSPLYFEYTAGAEHFFQSLK